MMAQYYVIVLNLLLWFDHIFVYSSLILSNRISSNSQITGELQLCAHSTQIHLPTIAALSNLAHVEEFHYNSSL